MTSRLFWKLLLSFWAAFALITQGVWLFVWFANAAPGPSERYLSSRVAPAILGSLATTLTREGVAGVQREIDALAPDDRRRIVVQRMGSAEPARPRYAVERTARATDGGVYRLLYRYQGPIHRPGPLNTPRSLVLLGLIGGPIFSALTAWYLTAPIRRLRRGFERLAAGDLSARLTPEMGRRRDEIADLARDLDAMASRLEQSAAARERLLHDVSHELRSPLTRLQLAIALARQEPSRTPAALERVGYEAGRLEAVLRELLTLARVESGLDEDDYFDLAGVLGSVLSDARFEAEAEAANVTIAFEADAAASEEGAPNLRGKAELVRWALENIVRNALRHSPRGGAVRVRLAFEPTEAVFRITVEDEGEGAPAAVLATMFEPFVRGEHPRAGFGLGLAVARRSVIAHGGTIDASNRPEGGLRVQIALPAAFSPAPERRSSATGGAFATSRP